MNLKKFTSFATVAFSIGLDPSFDGLERLWPSLYRILLGFPGFYRVLPSFSGYLPGFT